MSSQTTYPAALNDGATLGLFSPSEPIVGTRPERLRASLDLLTSHGFRVKYADKVFSEEHYQAGSPRERLADIDQLLADDEVRGLLATWGGKSCNQLVPHLNYAKFAAARKPVIGFSDVCVLLNAISYKTGLVTYHGPNIAGKMNETSHADLGGLRADGQNEVTNVFGNSAPSQWEVIRGGSGSGRLIGGNLSTFVLGCIGLPEVHTPEPKIFFWESASEPPQIIDQYLHALVVSGFFDSCAGMVVGQTLYKEEPRKDRALPDLLLSAFEGSTFPIVQCPTFGHSAVENSIVPIGAVCELDAAGATAAATVIR